MVTGRRPSAPKLITVVCLTLESIAGAGPSTAGAQMSTQQHPNDPRADGQDRHRWTRLTAAAIAGILAGGTRAVTTWIIERLGH